MTQKLLPGEGPVRFGCGALAGFVLAVILSLQFGGTSPFLIWGLIGAVICGLLAWRWGDRFWEWITQWW